MNLVKKLGFLFALGCSCYCLLEILYRGYTHWTMGVTGGVCCIGLHAIYTYFGKLHLFLRCLLGAALITLMEFSVGCIVNLKMHWNVWDYSGRTHNFKGQICLMACCFWYLLCIPVMILGKKLTSKMTLFIKA